MWDPYADFVHKKIDGGVDIYASHWPERSVERVAIIVHAGALQDEPGKEGTAHLLEHLIRYRGKIKGAEEIEDFFENQGGEFLPATNTLSTEYIFSGLATKDFMAEALKMIDERIFNFSPNERLLKKEKGIVKGEFRKENPLQYALTNKLREWKMLFSNTPIIRSALPIDGLPNTVDAISPDDLIAFHRRYYLPANISIVAAGGLPVEEIFELLADSFFSAIGGQRIALPKTMTEMPPLAENYYHFSVSDYLKHCAGVNVSRFKIAAVLPGIISDQEMKICFEMIDDFLDDEVRENLNWSYGSERERENFRALHCISIDFDDLPPDKLVEAEQAAKQALASLPENKELFEKIKIQSLKRLKILDYNVEKLIEDAAEELTLNHRLPTFAEKYAEREAITMEKIKKVFSYLSPDRLWTLMQRP